MSIRSAASNGAATADDIRGFMKRTGGLRGRYGMGLGTNQWLRGTADPETLRELVNLGGPWWVSYAILGAIIFSETGLLVGFFCRAIRCCSRPGFWPARACSTSWCSTWLLIVAAIVGDAVNYFLGLQMGEHVFEKGRLRFVKHSHLMAAKAFYERHGGKAIVLARFVPLVRTFTPFVAGVARMSYRDFAVYNIAGRHRLGDLDDAGRLLAGADSLVVQRISNSVVLAIVSSACCRVAIAAFRVWRRRKRSTPRKPKTQEIVDSVKY